MARPQVAAGGDGLQIWRVAANTLNKQSRTADGRMENGERCTVGSFIICTHQQRLLGRSNQGE
jgi:hypothetical protein